jgi:NAD(P)-dependent dehydrogenase (short-subunit alcohol dehydrogenase family)
MSKAALNAAGKSLAHDLKASGVAVAIFHPGLVSTAMINFNGQVSPEDAAAQLAARIEALNLSNTGTFWHANGEALPW